MRSDVLERHMKRYKGKLKMMIMLLVMDNKYIVEWAVIKNKETIE